MRVDFSIENKSKGNDRYPKFALDKDETARISILESPIMKYVHALQAPIVDPMTGEHQKVTKKTTKGEEYETEAYEFVAQAVCTGVLETVQANEVDPDNCPACKDVRDHPEKFKAPEPKYVCHIVRYKTMPGTLQPQTPFQAELVLWVLTQRKFDKVISIASEFGDPRKIDLQVGPCTNKTFQNYEMAACNGTSVWSQTEGSKNFVGQLWAANAADEEAMTNTVARPLSPTRYSADAAKVIDRYGMIGSPQAQSVGAAEFGAIAQSSQQAAMQNEQPAPWSQQGPPSFVQQPAPQQAPAFGQQGGQAPSYDTNPVTQQFQPQQQFVPTEQAPAQQFQQPTEQAPAQQFQQPTEQAPQPTQQQFVPTEQAPQPTEQPQQFQNVAQPAPAQQVQQPAAQPAPQQGGETLDFNALMAQMNNPQG